MEVFFSDEKSEERDILEKIYNSNKFWKQKNLNDLAIETEKIMQKIEILKMRDPDKQIQIKQSKIKHIDPNAPLTLKEVLISSGQPV